MNYNTLTLSSPLLPESFKHIAQPPNKLFYIGNSLGELCKRPRVAIVGARAVTPYGKQVTQQLAGQLAQQGIVVISGLAYGVDTYALQSALDAGGQCIAVLPSPLDNIVPASNRKLAQRIVEQGGVLITEYQNGSDLHKWHFVERNRIMSGLSDAVLITEAARKSGTLHTAEFAIDQGKLVMAVPGNITSKLSEGTNDLIRQGATPIFRSQDMFDALKTDTHVQMPLLHGSADPNEQIVIELIEQGVHATHELLDRSKLSAQLFAQTLMSLEIRGMITARAAEHWTLT